MIMKSVSKRVLAFLLAATMTASLAACGGSSSKPKETAAAKASDSKVAGGAQKSTKDTINIAINADPGNLSPFGLYDDMSSFIKNQVYDTLFAYGYDMKLTPLLATSWEKVDDITYKVNLRKDVKFSDGNAFTAKDVLFSMALCKKSTRAANTVLYVDLNKSKAIDDYTVQIAFTEPNAFAFTNLSALWIVNEASFNASKDQMVTTPVGTGAYTLKKWVNGSSLTLEANPNYWAGAPAIKTAIFQCISEAAQRTTALESGDVDLVMNLQNSDYKHVESTKGLAVYSKVGTKSDSFYFNMSENSIMKSKALRQAICYAIDNSSVLKVAYNGFGKPSTAIAAEGMKDYSKDWTSDLYKQNMDKAKKLFAESGVAKDSPVTIITNGKAEWITDAEMIQKWLAELGLKAKIINFEPAVYNDTCAKPTGWDIALTSNTAPSGFTLDMMNAFFGFSNYSKWSGPDYDKFKKLGADAAKSTDTALQAKNTGEMVTLVHDNVPMFAMVQIATNFGYKANLNYRVWGQNQVRVADLIFK